MFLLLHRLPLDIRYKKKINVYVHVCIFYYFQTNTNIQRRRGRSTGVLLSLPPVRRSPGAGTLHFPGCRGAGRGRGGTLFAGLMKHVYLCVCVCVCNKLFLVQDGTPTSQKLMHHPVAARRRDIYGCLMLYIACVSVSEGRMNAETREKEQGFLLERRPR